ncbi:MAG: hypothetical protein VW226_12060 [Rhodospirillaceae bacterium]|jgi:hypothetical protein
MTDLEPILVNTMSELAEHEFGIALYCESCDRWEQVDPTDWLDQGLPDISYAEMGFKCGECGAKGHKQVYPLVDGEMDMVAHH